MTYIMSGSEKNVREEGGWWWWWYFFVCRWKDAGRGSGLLQHVFFVIVPCEFNIFQFSGEGGGGLNSPTPLMRFVYDLHE